VLDVLRATDVEGNLPLYLLRCYLIEALLGALSIDEFGVQKMTEHMLFFVDWVDEECPTLISDF
jgi:hypothetical protein